MLARSQTNEKWKSPNEQIVVSGTYRAMVDKFVVQGCELRPDCLETSVDHRYVATSDDNKGDRSACYYCWSNHGIEKRP